MSSLPGALEAWVSPSKISVAQLIFYYTGFVYIANIIGLASSFMKNITITLDEQTAAWVRLAAAKRKMSVSRLIGDLLHDRMHETRDYNEAMRRFFSHKPFNFEWVGGRRPTREEINDRARAREDLVREELARKETK
jgi:hypothetical protein